MAKVSVLVAVHNTADFLPKCIESLLHQTLADLQIICIDDASTDRSPAILDHYSRLDPRVEVVHLPHNLGMSKARNKAVELARGEYVCMLDSDDWYSEDALDKAVRVFEQYPRTDCVLFRFVYAYACGDHFSYDEFRSVPFQVLTGSEACRLSLDWQIHGIYMVRTDIQRRYPYDDTSMVYSDENTTRMHYAVSREVRCCDGTYYYRQHDHSSTHAVTVRRFDKLKAKESLIAQLQSIDAEAAMISHVVNQLWLDVVDLCMFHHVHAHELTPDERRYGLSELHRVWQTIDRTLLLPQTTRKLGYRHMPSWWLFRMQEWLYFTLRGLMGKNY